MKLKIIFIYCLFSLCLSKSVAQNSLKITGGNVKVTDNVAIVLKDCQLQNNGTFTATNGIIEIKGTGTNAQSEIGGAGTTTFHNLKINKSINDAQLGTSITVNNEMEMTSGLLNLQANNLTLGTTNGILIGENETTHITSTATGQIIKTLDLNTPNAINPGNLGIQITASSNLGNTEIRRGHDHQTIPTGTSVLRHFTITPSNNSGLDATLIFKYLDAELNGLNENSLVLLEENNGWMIDGYTNRNFTTNTITFSGYDGLYQYTLGQNEDDSDMDGVSSGMDNCPDVANANQADADNDLVGDVCDSCPNGDDMVDANNNSIIDDCECQDIDLNLTGTLTVDKSYIADNNITSDEIINIGTSALYKAETSITLSAGFHVVAGAELLAVISDCEHLIDISLTTPVQGKVADISPTLLENLSLEMMPNPVKTLTTVQYFIPKTGKVSLVVQNLNGQEIAILLQNQQVDRGAYQLNWNAQQIPAGTYLLSLQIEESSISKKLIVVN